MITWHDTKKESPKADKVIALLLNSLTYGSKWPDTFEIVFGRTYYQFDKGIKVLCIESNFIGNTKVSDAIAWADAKEFIKPEFLVCKSFLKLKD